MVSQRRASWRLTHEVRGNPTWQAGGLPYAEDRTRWRSATYNFRIVNYPARVKGGWRRRGFFCGGFPFFAPQKNQINRGSVQKLCRNSELDTWVDEKTGARVGSQQGRLEQALTSRRLLRVCTNF